MKVALARLCGLLCFVSGFPGLEAEDVKVFPLSTELVEGERKGASEGFVLAEAGFDSSAEISDARERSGAVYMSFKPGAVWAGELPGFIVTEMEIGGEERVFCTDVFESGDFLFVHYGIDHYQTKAVSVIDKERREVALLTAFAYEDVSRLHFDEDENTVYFTTLEGNLDGQEEARLIAYSLAEEKVLWQSDAGTAHGDFLVYKKHIVTHYGFTGEEDFVCVIDRGSGAVLKKQKISTAASHLWRGEGDEIIAPCYTGVVRFSFREN